MATHLFGNGVYQSASHQPATTLPVVVVAIKAIFRMVREAFFEANAARHIYERQLARDVPRAKAARRTFEMLYTGTSMR